MIKNSDSNLDYALRAVQDVRLRNTEEFRQWIGMPGNKELFLDLMACREALMREKLERERRKKARIYVLATVSATAAVFILALLIPSLLPGAFRQTEEPVRFFASAETANHVILQMDGCGEQLLEDSVMDVKDWKHAVPATGDTVCFQTVVTPRGKDFLLVLADGTKVWLNAESTLRYPVAFKGRERRVELLGEACFEVTKDERHPFVVSAGGMDTRVLGTKFNVRSYTAEERHVTLVQGKVEVTDKAGNGPVVLQPGEDLSYTETGEVKISRVNTATYIAWTEGLFYFEDAPLEEIMRSLGRWYNVNIDFEQAELYGIRLNFWASRNAHLNEALELLNKLEKVRADYQDGTVTIKHI